MHVSTQPRHLRLELISSTTRADITGMYQYITIGNSGSVHVRIGQCTYAHGNPFFVLPDNNIESGRKQSLFSNNIVISILLNANIIPPVAQCNQSCCRRTTERVKNEIAWFAASKDAVLY